MNYLIIGAGAIGTYIGGSLLKSGSKVVFLERESVVHSLQKKGLIISLEDEVYSTSDFQVFSNLNQALEEQVDIVIFAMKSFDTEGVVKELVQYKNRFDAVLCLQNGVENEQLITKYLGTDKVIGGSVTSAVERIAIGQASLEKKRGIGIVEALPLSKLVVDEFNRAGLTAKLYPKLADLKWSKMLSNLLGNATSAILNMTPVEIFQNPKSYEIEYLQMKEALQVMDKLGIDPTNLPGIPMKLLLWIMLKLPRRLSKMILATLVGEGRGDKMPSFHIDLHSGQKVLESTYLNGAICRFGELANVPTPVNYYLNQLLTEMAQRKELIQEFDHEINRIHDDILKCLMESPNG